MFYTRAGKRPFRLIYAQHYKRLPCHWQIPSLKPGDAIATRGQELKRAQLACALREGGFTILSPQSFLWVSTEVLSEIKE